MLLPQCAADDAHFICRLQLFQQQILSEIPEVMRACEVTVAATVAHVYSPIRAPPIYPCLSLSLCLSVSLSYMTTYGKNPTVYKSASSIEILRLMF